MATTDTHGDPLERAMGRMQDASWLILSALDPARPLPGIEIIKRVEAVYAEAGYPQRHLDPSTLHYGLKRMTDDGLVRREGERDVDVPGPRGASRRESRAVFVITGEGQRALALREQLEMARRRAVFGFGAPAQGGV
jgi:DNA-binding PadR family transcriptional regulator